MNDQHLRAALRRARHGNIKAKCRQRAREELALARQARDQGFPDAMRAYLRSAREYRRIARQEVRRT